MRFLCKGMFDCLLQPTNCNIHVYERKTLYILNIIIYVLDKVHFKYFVKVSTK